MDDMTKKASVPAIRFKGFTDAWEQCELYEYLDVSNEKNVSDTYTRFDVLSVSGDYGIVNQIEFQGRSFAGASVSNYGVVHTGDVVYTKSPLNSNPYGIIKTNKGKTGIVSTLYAVYHPKENVDPDFVQTYFEQHARMNNYMHPLVNKGAKNDMKVSSENALKGLVIFPELEEQHRIVALFHKIDALITLHQRKLDKLHNVKKSLLEKMFPKNGADVPEIRFSGFTYAWEQYKLGQMCSEFQSGDFISADRITQDDVYPVFGGNGLRGYTSRYNHDGVYALIGRQGALCGNMNISYGKAYFTEHAVAVAANSSHDTEFLFYLFGILNLGQYSGQSAQPGLAVSKLITVSASTPKLNEQRQISGLLLKFDHLITLHQRKLEKLRQIKKALLEKMFV